MSISNTTENALMLLIFNATAWANYADNAASAPQTNVHCALHTADPGEAGTMSTSEAAYTSYARVNVARSGSGWTVSNNAAVPVAEIAFPAATGGSETETHFSTGKTGGGATAILFSGTVTPNIAVATGVTPKLTVATSISLD
jgi:hypothetical protein